MTDIVLTRGDDRTLFATVTDENEAIVNLTGALAVTFTIRSTPTGTAVLTRGLTTGITIPAPLTGVIEVALTATQTAALVEGTYDFDLVLLDAANKTTRIDEGTLLVKPVGSPGADLTNVAQVRALVATDLSDPQLAEVIAREEAILASEVGALSGSRVETFVITDLASGLPVRLRRPTSAVAVTEGNVATTDIRLASNGRVVARVSTSGFQPASWLGVVEVTYIPNDTARVVSWVIELVRARLAETGFESETDTGYTYSKGAQSHAAVLAAAIADVLAPPGSGRRGLRSRVMSTAGSAGWIGSSRP